MGKQYLNGVLYGTGEIIKFSPYIYSLEEREVGVWTDGKPLYEKTVSFNFTGSVSNWTLFDDSISYDSLVGATTKLVFSNNNDQVMSYPDRDTSPRFCIKTDHKLYYYTTVASTGYVTVQYTKTTDTPGSGHYTTNGGEAHHYSTSEQIVGTWIDGKPLYEKTLHIVNQRMGHDPNASPQDTVIPHGINNLALMVSVKPCMYDTSSELKLPSDANGWYLNSDRNIGGAIRANNSSIYFYGGTGFTEASPTRHWYFTLRYTKTTD